MGSGQSSPQVTITPDATQAAGPIKITPDAPAPASTSQMASQLNAPSAPSEEAAYRDKAAEGRHARARIGKDMGVPELGPEEYTGAKGAIDRFFRGGMAMGKEVLFPQGSTEGQRMSDIANKLIFDPMRSEAAKGEQTTGLESLGHKAASYLPVLGPMAAGAGEVLGKGDAGGFADAGLTLLAAHQAMAVDNAWKYGAGKSLRSAVTRVSAEVEKHADAIRTADAQLNAGQGVPGTLDLMKPFNELQQGIQSRAANPDLKMPNAHEAQFQLSSVMGAKGPTVDWDTMQRMRSEVGRLLAKAQKADKTSVESGLLSKLYRDYSGPLEDRATKDLGLKDSWKQYNAVHSNLMQAKYGPLGDALNATTGYDFWNALNDKANGAQIGRTLKDLQAYGLDDRFQSLVKETKSVIKDLDNGGHWFDWRKRLGLAGAYTMAGIPHSFMSAYSTAMLADYFRAMSEGGQAGELDRMAGLKGPQIPGPRPVQRGLPQGQATPFQGGGTPFYGVNPQQPQGGQPQGAAGAPVQGQGGGGGWGGAIGRTVGQAAQGARAPAAKVQELGGEGRDLGPEWNAQNRSYEIEKLKEIVRNKDAPQEDKQIARARLVHATQEAQEQTAPKVAPKPKSNVPEEPNPTPERRALVGRGAHGQVVVEFPDAWHKELFSATGRSRRQFSGKGSGIDPNFEGLKQHFGSASQAEIYDLAKEYKARIMQAIKEKKEGTTYVAPSTKEPD